MQLATTINFLRTDILHVFGGIDDTEGPQILFSFKLCTPLPIFDF